MLQEEINSAQLEQSKIPQCQNLAYFFHFKRRGASQMELKASKVEFAVWAQKACNTSESYWFVRLKTKPKFNVDKIPLCNFFRDDVIDPSEYTCTPTKTDLTDFLKMIEKFGLLEIGTHPSSIPNLPRPGLKIINDSRNGTFAINFADSCLNTELLASSSLPDSEASTNISAMSLHHEVPSRDASVSQSALDRMESNFHHNNSELRSEFHHANSNLRTELLVKNEAVQESVEELRQTVKNLTLQIEQMHTWFRHLYFDQNLSIPKK